jgi:hypothetical protein
MAKFIPINVLNVDCYGTMYLSDFYFDPSKVSSLMKIHDIKRVFVVNSNKDEYIHFKTKLVVDGHEYISDDDIKDILKVINCVTDDEVDDFDNLMKTVDKKAVEEDDTSVTKN